MEEEFCSNCQIKLTNGDTCALCSIGGAITIVSYKIRQGILAIKKRKDKWEKDRK